MKRLIALLLSILMLTTCCAAFAQEAAPVKEAACEELVAGAYRIENGGYLFVGTEKAALFDGNARDEGVAMLVARLAGDLEVVSVSTSVVGGEAIELGGFTFEPLAVEGSLEGTAYLDGAQGILVSGALLGDGTANLACQAVDSDVDFYISGYRAYLASVEAIAAKAGDALLVCANGAVLDKQYLADLCTVVKGFVDADTDFVLELVKLPGSVGDFRCAFGSAAIYVHMPFGGLYGYDLGGSTLCESDEDYRFYICDYGKFQTIRDTDIQSCYVLMDDTDALLIDCDMYNGKLFWEAVEKLVGDRALSVYITHNHGDHLANLQHIDPERLTAIYWPKDELPPSWGYNPFENEALAAKVVYLDYDTDYTIASHDLVLCKMTSHSTGGTVLINKTDRVAFSGDALGTQTYKGGTSTGRLTVEEYLTELNYLADTYGEYFDDIYQAHNLYSTPKVIEYLQMICETFLEKGPDIMINGTVYAFNGQVVDQEQFAAIFGNALFDAQMPYAIGLGIGKTALEAYAAAQ